MRLWLLGERRPGVSRGSSRSFGLLGFLLFVVAGLLPSRPLRADVILVVDTAADTIANDGLCSLREAITAANNDANYFGCLGNGGGFDLIEFALGAGTPVIQLSSALPAVTGPVAIDGGPGRVEIRGTGSGSGLIVSGAGAAGSAIRRLVIDNFNTGVVVEVTSNITLKGNFIGTNASGSAASVNTVGILFAEASGRIGGTGGWSPGGSCTGDCNLISGNTSRGIFLIDGSSAVVQGNLIGTNAAGSVAIGNGVGVLVNESQATIGGTSAGAGNLISGNGEGILIQRFTDLLIGTFILGNRIGTDTSGSSALANEIGIHVNLDNRDHPVAIGGATALAGNLISGNLGSGILLVQTDLAAIQGNRIGTRADGTNALPNGGAGIQLSSSTHDTLIGGTGPGEGNVIAYNATGVSIGVFNYSNGLRGNSIHSNVGKGIALADNQMNTIATPTITGVAPVSGTACPGCAVDVFSDLVDEGRIYEGSTFANGVGSWSFNGAVSGPNVTATAMGATGSTSEFSEAVPEPSAGLLLGVGVIALGMATSRGAAGRPSAVAGRAGRARPRD